MSAFLDVLSIGFKSDSLKNFASELKHTETELDRANKKVTNLEKQLEDLDKAGKKGSDEFKKIETELSNAKEQVKKFGDELKIMQGKSQYQLLQLKKNFFAITKSLALLGTAALAVKKTMQFYEQAEQLDFLAQKSNIAVESLQRLGNAVQRYGGNTESTASTVEQFNTKEYKEKAISYGIRVSGDNPEQTLENIARKMETLKSDAKKWELAKNLGLDEGTTRLLIQGVDKYREELKRADKYKLYTKEDIERMKDYRQIQQDIRMNIQNIQAAISKFLLPAITAAAKIIRGITGFFDERGGLFQILGVLLGVSTAVLSISYVIKNFIPILTILKAGFLGAAKSVWAFTAALLTNPLTWVILGITALIVVIQDLIVFLQGGDSAIGKLWESWGYDLENIRQGFEIWGERIKRWWTNFLSIFNKNIKWQDAVKDIDVLKELSPEEQKKLNDWEKQHGNFSDYSAMMQQGQRILTAANNNPLNSVSKEAISNSYQTQALTNNNNQNTKSINETNTKNAQNTVNNTKSVNVNIGSIQTQAQNGNELMREIETISDLDNGFSAA